MLFSSRTCVEAVDTYLASVGGTVSSRLYCVYVGLDCAAFVSLLPTDLSSFRMGPMHLRHPTSALEKKIGFSWCPEVFVTR